jgi:hypothetical protein
MSISIPNHILVEASKIFEKKYGFKPDDALVRAVGDHVKSVVEYVESKKATRARTHKTVGVISGL